MLTFAEVTAVLSSTTTRSYVGNAARPAAACAIRTASKSSSRGVSARRIRGFVIGHACLQWIHPCGCGPDALAIGEQALAGHYDLQRQEGLLRSRRPER